MADADREKKDASGLSPATLAIASASSMAAAIFVHEVWQGGAILGAAVTPVIVAIVSESLKKPTQKLATVRPVITARPARRGGTRAPEPVEAQAVELEREDRFGIWTEQERERRRARSPWRRLNGRHLKIALATGVLAFVVGVVALTGTELVFGGSVGGSEDRTTIFRGGGDEPERERPATTGPTTQPDETEPEEPVQTEPVPQQEPPAETVPTEPAPGGTAPEAVPGAGAPAPAEPAPGATQPAPAVP